MLLPLRYFDVVKTCSAAGCDCSRFIATRRMSHAFLKLWASDRLCFRVEFRDLASVISCYTPFYRVIHDLWTLLQEMISWVFVIKNVHKNMFAILDGYRVMAAWDLELNVKISENKCNKITNKHNTQ